MQFNPKMRLLCFATNRRQRCYGKPEGDGYQHSHGIAYRFYPEIWGNDAPEKHGEERTQEETRYSRQYSKIAHYINLLEIGITSLQLLIVNLIIAPRQPSCNQKGYQVLADENSTRSPRPDQEAPELPQFLYSYAHTCRFL